MKKVSLLLLLSAILLLTACTGEPGGDALDGPAGDADALVSGRPALQMNAGDTVYDGVEGAYCWFQTANDIQCEPGPAAPAPENAAPVAPGDILTFTVGSESDAPLRMTASLLDDPDASGAPRVIALDSDLAADYRVDLPAGQHRISVVAEFSATEADTNFITTIFALDVAEALALEPTAIPTEAPLESSTDAPPVEPTEESTVEPTEQPTVEPTAEPTVEPTAEPTVEPTAEPTIEPTNEPAVESTDEPAALPPTSAPTIVPPSPVPSSTTPPAADSYLADIVPEVVIVKGDNRYVPVGVEFCAADAADCQNLTGSAPDAQIILATGETVLIVLAEGGPTQMAFWLTDTAQTEILDRLTLRGNTLALYTVNAAPGTYLLLVQTDWLDAAVTYYFRLQITP